MSGEPRSALTGEEQLKRAERRLDAIQRDMLGGESDDTARILLVIADALLVIAWTGLNR